MATKAAAFRRYEEMLRARENTRRKRKPRRAARMAEREAKPHNVGVRAGKNAVVQLEDSAPNARPPRKSTRKSANRMRSSTTLEHNIQQRLDRPQARALRKKKARRHTGPKRRAAARRER